MTCQYQVMSHVDVMTHLFDHLMMFCPYHTEQNTIARQNGCHMNQQ